MRNPATLFMAVAACAVLIAGCTGGGLFSHLLPIPTAPPSPTVNVVPATLTYSSGNQAAQTITASETNGNTFFSASTSDATIATVAADQLQTNVFHVSPASPYKAGSCKITVSDGSGNSFSVSVTNQ